MLARAGARSAREAESDGATGQAVCRPRNFGPLGRCTHIGAGARRDRFSTIDKRGRRCLREPAHGLGEWPRAMARRGRLLPDLSISAHTPQHVPDACSHRMQLSSLHRDEAPGQTVRRTSKAGFRRLHVHVRTCHTPCNASTGPCTFTLSSDSRPLASRGEETLGEVVPNTAHQMNARAV